MVKPIQVSASVLCADFSKLAEEIRKTVDAGCDRIHVDVMDGHFVPNISIGPVIVQAIRPLTKLPLEAHLMIENPHFYVDAFAGAGADIIAIHAECYGCRRSWCQKWDQFPKEVEAIDVPLAREAMGQIKKAGKKVFMALNPGTPMCLGPLLKDLDGVLVMSVNPGFPRQKFLDGVLSKVRALREELNFNGDITIDGGVNEATAPSAVGAGANILVTASYFYGSQDPRRVVNSLKSI